MKTCLVCGHPSGRCKFCSRCRYEKNNASAIISQNAKKLVILFRSKWLNPSWFEKFLIYTENITKYWKILMKFKTADELRNLIVVNNYSDK